MLRDCESMFADESVSKTLFAPGLVVLLPGFPVKLDILNTNIELSIVSVNVVRVNKLTG